ncbi:MAG: hypothetical protein HKN05_13690 [Rhizobiales bacterium]|nr:hypothetical protein [Hyphomicrobiales bacterium]
MDNQASSDEDDLTTANLSRGGNDDGTGVAIALYEDEAAANAAVPHIQAVCAGLADFLTAPPEIISYTKAQKNR